jgi:hypothetical protein
MKPNEYELSKYYPARQLSPVEFDTYPISFGPIHTEQNFSGVIEFLDVTQIVINDMNAELLITHFNLVQIGDIIAIADGENIISEIDAYVLNIHSIDNITIELIDYQDIIVKSVIEQDVFLNLDFNDSFNLYYQQSVVELGLFSYVFNQDTLEYQLEFRGVPRDILYLNNDIIRISQNITSESVYSIFNFLLTHEVEPNKYEVLIYNPTLEFNNVYTKIIEVRKIQGNSKSEIISNNIELYERIIFHSN